MKKFVIIPFMLILLSLTVYAADCNGDFQALSGGSTYSCAIPSCADDGSHPILVNVTINPYQNWTEYDVFANSVPCASITTPASFDMTGPREFNCGICVNDTDISINPALNSNGTYKINILYGEEYTEPPTPPSTGGGGGSGGGGSNNGGGGGGASAPFYGKDFGATGAPEIPRTEEGFLHGPEEILEPATEETSEDDSGELEPVVNGITGAVIGNIQAHPAIYSLLLLILIIAALLTAYFYYKRKRDRSEIKI
ncbi:MAG TPA: hypothetical protein VJI75_02005 [Candidatus Nanoarchaeia archaeon]|nr:hypothetical protein [Candidatus Nanoarchaeia archaeon]